MEAVAAPGRSRFWTWIRLIFGILLLICGVLLATVIVGNLRYCYELKYQERTNFMVHQIKNPNGTNWKSYMDAGKHINSCCNSMPMREKVELYAERIIILNVLCVWMLDTLVIIYQSRKTPFSVQHPVLLSIVSIGCLAGLGCPVFAVLCMDTWLGEDLIEKMADMKLDWFLVATFLVLMLILLMSQKRSPKADATTRGAQTNNSNYPG